MWLTWDDFDHDENDSSRPPAASPNSSTKIKQGAGRGSTRDDPQSPSTRASRRAGRPKMARTSSSDDFDDASSVSEVDEDHEYEVERIVTESEFEDNVTRYLVKWVGYKDERNSWEPAENFLTPETLEDWQKEKQRVLDGTKKPFDLVDWFNRQEEWLARRREKREQKEAQREQNRSDQRRSALTALASNRNQTAGRADHGVEQLSDDESLLDAPQRAAIRRRLSTNDTAHISRKRGAKEGRSGKLLASVSATTSPTQRHALLPRNESDSASRDATRSSANGAKVLDKKTLWAGLVAARKPAKVAKGAGPSRTPWEAPSILTKNWDAEPRKRKRAAGPAIFRTAHKAWWEEKKSREERPPDSSKLQLFRPGDGPIAARPQVGLQEDLPGLQADHQSSTADLDALFLSSSPSPLRDLWPVPSEGNEGDGSRQKPDEQPEEPSAIRTDGYDNHVEMIDAPLPVPSAMAYRPAPTHPATSSGVGALQRKRSQPDITRSNAGYQAVKDWGARSRHITDVITDRPNEKPARGTLRIENSGNFEATVSFDGIDHRYWLFFIRSIKVFPRDVSVRITQTCSATEYIQNYHCKGQGYYSSGYIAWIPKKKTWVQHFLEDLQLNQKGGLFFAEAYTLIMYRPDCPDWQFLDRYFSSDSPRCDVRFFFRSPVPRQPPTPTIAEVVPTNRPLASSTTEATPQVLPLAQTAAVATPTEQPPAQTNANSIPTRKPSAVTTANLTFTTAMPTERPLAQTAAEAKSTKHLSPLKIAHMQGLSIQQTSPDPLASFPEATHHTESSPTTEAEREAPNLQTAMATPQSLLEDLFEYFCRVKWSYIVPPAEKEGQPVKVFLYYPEEAREEHDFLKKFFTDDMNLKTYSSLESGEWDLFTKSKNVPRGVLLFHVSVTRFDQVPAFYHALANGRINVVQFDMKPGTGSPAYAQKIFPSGGAFLLPDSLVLQKPDLVVRILAWYRRNKIPIMRHGSQWKCVFRPRFREWIRRVVDNEDSCRSKEEIQPFKNILLELTYSIPEEDWDEAEEYNTPLERATFASPRLIPGYHHEIGIGSMDDLEALKHNDATLVRWFGKWTLEQEHIEKYRRFHILFDGWRDDMDSRVERDAWSKTWRHIQVGTSGDFMKYEGVEKSEAEHEENKRRGLANKSPKEVAMDGMRIGAPARGG